MELTRFLSFSQLLKVSLMIKNTIGLTLQKLTDLSIPFLFPLQSCILIPLTFSSTAYNLSFISSLLPMLAFIHPSDCRFLLFWFSVRWVQLFSSLWLLLHVSFSFSRFPVDGAIVLLSSVLLFLPLIHA